MLYQSNHISKSGKNWSRHCAFSLFAGTVLIFTGLLSILHAVIPNIFPEACEKILNWLIQTNKKINLN